MDSEKARWKASCLMYHELGVYRSTVAQIKIHVWWKLSTIYPYLVRQISSVMAVLLGDQPWGLHVHFRKSHEVLCTLCDTRRKDTPVHILFECHRLNECRDKHLSKIRGLMPIAMKTDFDHSSNLLKTQLFLSGFRCDSLIDDWCELFCSTACFIHDMYVKRKKFHEIQ